MQWWVGGWHILSYDTARNHMVATINQSHPTTTTTDKRTHASVNTLSLSLAQSINQPLNRLIDEWLWVGGANTYNSMVWQAMPKSAVGNRIGCWQGCFHSRSEVLAASE